MAVDVCITYKLMLVSMTLTLIQDRSGSAEENNILAVVFKLCMTVALSVTYN